MCSVHSLTLNPGLLWQHHSCTIIKKSGDINAGFTPAAEEMAVFSERSKAGLTLLFT